MAGGLNVLRSNQQLLYAIAGVSGGALGAVFAELVVGGQEDADAAVSQLRLVLETALWSAAFASILGLLLFIAGEWYQRHDLSPGRAAQVLAGSALAGFVAGAAAQYLFSMEIGSFELKYYALRIVAWAVMGALLGALLSRAVPNLGMVRGLGAGAVGGAIGCMGFLLASMFLPGFAGRVAGIALLGLALGLAMYFVQNMAREASVEVEWAPYETSFVGLGSQPVFVGGGGEEHIFKKGLPPQVSSLVFNGGVVEHIETVTGKRTPLQDGSRLNIGGLTLVVHAPAIGGAPQKNQNLPVVMSVVATVVVAAVAFTLFGPRPEGDSQASVGASRITTLGTVGESAALDTSEPITEVNVRLDWQAPVDLDIAVFYRLSPDENEVGSVYFGEASGPGMFLDVDSGVGGVGGDNQENIKMSTLDGFKEIFIAANIFSHRGSSSFSDYDGRVTVQTNNGDEIVVPLTATEPKSWIMIAKISFENGEPTITNINAAVTTEESVEILGSPWRDGGTRPRS